MYRTRGRRLIEENRIPVWNRVQNKNQIFYRINDEHPMVLDLLSRLPPEARGDLLRVIEVAGASLPMDALFADLGGDTTSVVGSAASEQALRYAAADDVCSPQQDGEVNRGRAHHDEGRGAIPLELGAHRADSQRKYSNGGDAG